MNASLNEKLRNVKWGEFKLGELFEVVSYKKCFDANKVTILEKGGHPYIVRQGTENGQKGNKVILMHRPNILTREIQYLSDKIQLQCFIKKSHILREIK